ncbi:MAG: hypothetical protein JXA99_10555, partial [Candidatus Lokiarchaeota archaeon]|nr:hypothetical protein [Candidatus Lokiarchaeota archaeon]
ATKMMGMFSSDDAIGGNIVAHGCHFRVMFKTKGFSSNNSLKRKAIIVDAPDLPPEECEFYITKAGIADSEEIDLQEDQSLNIELDSLYEESNNSYNEKNNNEQLVLTDIKGIGKGTLTNLNQEGINNINDLLEVDPKELSQKMNGISEAKIKEWQKLASTKL